MGECEYSTIYCVLALDECTIKKKKKSFRYRISWLKKNEVDGTLKSLFGRDVIHLGNDD